MKTVEKYDVLERGFSKPLETKATWKKVKKRWEDEHRKLYIAVDVNASWERVKRTPACIQRTRPSQNINMILRYSQQTKAQKPADKNTFERYMKL